MNILHYIPHLSSDPNSVETEFLDKLLSVKLSGIDNCLLSSPSSVSRLAKYSQSTPVYSIRPASLFTFWGKKKIQKIVAEKNIRIVHIHSITDCSAVAMLNLCRRLRLPVVVTPYKQLMTWNTMRYNPVLRLLKRYMANKIIDNDSTVLHAVTPQESSCLKKQFSTGIFGALKDKANWVSVICDTRKNKDGIEDTYRFIDQLNRLYVKLADSNPFWLMKASDRELENELLALGSSLSAGRSLDTSYLPVDDIRKQLASTSTQEWRYIQLHSYSQDILQFVQQGYSVLTGVRDFLDIESVERFAATEKREVLDTAVPRIKKSTMHQVAEDYPRNEKEQRLCVIFLNVKHLYDKNRLNRRHLAELHNTIRFEEYDEYSLESMLTDLGILKFASRIMAILQESYLLPPGYQPLAARRDRQTNAIKKKLFKSNIL